MFEHRADPAFHELIEMPDPLTMGEMRSILSAKLGLRYTSAADLETELSQGVLGDYVVLSSVVGLLPAGDSSLLVDGADRDGKYEDRQGWSDAPVKFSDALHRVIDDTLARFLSESSQKDTPLEIALRDDFFPQCPLFLLIRSVEDLQPYDFANYFGLGKAGKRWIDPEQFISVVRLSDSDKSRIRRSYAAFLTLPVGTRTDYLGSVKMQRTLGDVACSDITRLYLQKILDLVKTTIEYDSAR
jgi:hypothetical protein